MDEIISISSAARSHFFTVSCALHVFVVIPSREEVTTMATRQRIVLALATVLIVVAGVAAGRAFGNSRINYLTFNGTVALPGVLLPAGTYVFEVVEPGAAGDVVSVSSREGRHYFMAFTRFVSRPPRLRRSQTIGFGEAPAGTPPPIAVWYPLDSSRGHEFIYPR
jgi:hypothetical protein